ncbi:MAG: YDG domain-containing protein, partial [Oscillospiraceae bacterium]
MTFDQKFTSTGGALTAGNYYLDKDVTLTSTITIDDGVTVNLCLNGHKLIGAATGGAVIEVFGTLNLYDCKSTKNTITNPNDNKSVDINGGVITGGTGKVGNNTTGGGVYVGGSGNFTMHGGTIAGNSVDTANSAGGGVYVVGSFTMNGGAISHNKSTKNGGGLCVGGAGQSSTTAVGDATLNGGTISNNAAGENGGAIRVTSSEDSNKERATLILSGTTIKDNSATVAGAGIHTNGKVILDSDCGAQDIFLAGDLPVEVKKDATISATINLHTAGKTPGDLVTGVTTEAQANLFKVTGYAAGYTTKYDATTKSIKLVTTLTNTAINKTITYPGATYDVTALFTRGTGAGTPTYTLQNGTGAGAGTGSLSNSTLTITTLGTFQIEMTTAATDTHEAGAPVTATLTVNKGAAPAAPTGVTATPTSVKGKADGTLTGVSSLMEYKLSTATGNYTAITETTVTGLAAGTYSVRVKETDLYLAGADASVTVTEGAALTVTFDSKGGSAVTAISDISYNTAISAPAAPTLANYIFDGWFTTDGGSTRWDFTNGKVTASITLYAKWTEKTAVSITETAQTKTYTGSALAFDITGSNATGNFEIVYKQGTTAVASPTNAGSYDVTITRPEDDNYAAYNVTITGGLVIAQKHLTEAMLTITDSYTYTGTAITPTCTVTDGSVLTGNDYTAEVTDNINAGTAKVTIIGKGNYSGSISKTFSVEQKEVTLTLADPGSLVYTGAAISPTATASGTVNGEKLSVTFSLTSGDGINVGDHTFTATALTGDKAANYKLPATVTYTMTITKATIAGVTADGYTGIYDGKPHDAVTVSGAPTGSAISYCETQDGTYTSANKTVQNVISEGQFWYKVTNPNYGEFTGSVMVNISALQLTTSVAATVTTEKIYDGNQSAAVLTPGTLANNHDGENVSLAATAGYDSKSVGESKTITITYTISGTSASNYIKPADATLSTGKITTKPLSVTGTTATSRDYNGTTTVAIVGGALSGKVESDTVTLGGTATGSVQTADKGNNKAVTVTGYTISGGDAGNYTLTQPTGVTVNITPRDMSSVAITAIPKQDFTGAEVKPIVVVNDGGSLVLDKDYTVSYSGNTNLGTNTATVTVTGKGNYNSATSKDVKFTIGYANLVPNSYALPTGFVPTTWYKDPITVTAVAGYTVSKTVAGSYSSSITFDTDGEQAVTFYIKNTAGGIA